MYNPEKQVTFDTRRQIEDKQSIRVITKLPNSEQSYKGKVNPDLIQAFLKKCWVESDFKAPNLPPFITAQSTKLNG